MIDNNFKKAIKIISRLLTINDIKWALIGSTNMQLQGIKVQPHDLDLVVQLKDLGNIQKIFSKFNPSAINQLKPLGKAPGWEIKVEIGGVEVQFLGEKDSGEYVSKLLANKLIKIKMDEIKIPCFTLQAEAQTYAETKREQKAKIILDFLEK